MTALQQTINAPHAAPSQQVLRTLATAGKGTAGNLILSGLMTGAISPVILIGTMSIGAPIHEFWTGLAVTGGVFFGAWNAFGIAASKNLLGNFQIGKEFFDQISRDVHEKSPRMFNAMKNKIAAWCNKSNMNSK